VKTTQTTSKRYGLIAASPTEYLVHQRLGRVRFPGRGAAAWVIPGLDRVFLIPSSAQSAAFRADQITAENQGVVIGGFTIWNIADPERAIQAVDFTDPAAGLIRVGEQLREVVEAVIRREVANLSLDQVLRQRTAMTDLLREELAGVAERWGLVIAAVEIRTVEISSKQLFENMQAKFRDALRLESARSAMETDEAINRARAEDREEAARRELAFRLAEIERDEEARRQEIIRDQRLEQARDAARRERELAKLDEELAMVCAREERQQAALAAHQALMEIEEFILLRRHQTEQLRAEQRERLATIENRIASLSIEINNLKDTRRLLVEALPEIVTGLNVGTVNLGDPALVAGVQSLLQQFTGSALPK
jgi:SPFH domain / Band 7 family